ncbi:MAG TPA: microtubule-binding protein, partial [Bdellovibrionales bacterium]|nr:microtubule-binding protein [Bdellovibrionales bacterium]
VTASIRQGTDGVKQFIENRQLTKQNEDLKQQLKVYESLKQNYLETQAQQSEQETYDVLMKKLSLLQEEAKDEKDRLREAAKENEQKEQALNQYQQIVRNIINANMLAKARIKNRDTLITKKEDVIEDQATEISQLEGDLQEKRQEIEKGEKRIENLEGAMAQKMKELEASYKMREISEKRFKEKQAALRKEVEGKIAALRQQNEQAEAEMARLSGDLAKATQEAQQLASGLTATKGELQATKGQLDATKGALNATKGQLADAKGRLDETKGQLDLTKGQLDQTKGRLAATEGELAKAQENLNAKKKLAANIKGKFKAGGIDAEVDGKTGDVLLSFEGEYFDTGQAKLKPGMKKVLERAMPAYAQSLFEDPKIAEKIENVEIIGYASPTYKGKVIDPQKLSAKERDAVNFNLDLSYDRARSIFDHVYSKMAFSHKSRLLPLVKVTGKSFLGDKLERDVAGQDPNDFCKKNDCAKKQTVIIRFKLKD